MSDDAYLLWINGELSLHATIGAIGGDLSETLQSVERLNAQAAELKARLGHVMSVAQSKVSEREYQECQRLLALRGLAISFSRPSVRMSVNARDLQAIIAEYEDQIPGELVAMLRGTIRQTPVDGTQRIQRLGEKSDGNV